VVDGDVGGLHGAAGQLGRGAALADVLADGGVRRGADGLRRAVPQGDGAGCAAGVVADQAVVVAGEAGVDRGADVPLGDACGAVACVEDVVLRAVVDVEARGAAAAASCDG